MVENGDFSKFVKMVKCWKMLMKTLKTIFALIFFYTLYIRNLIYNPKFYQHFLISLIISDHWSMISCWSQRKQVTQYWKYYCIQLVTLSAVPYYIYLIMQWIFLLIVISFILFNQITYSHLKIKNQLQFKVQSPLCFSERNGPNGAHWELIPNRSLWAASAIAIPLRLHLLACLASKSCSNFLNQFYSRDQYHCVIILEYSTQASAGINIL